MLIEQELKALILSRYPSMKAFTDVCGIAPSTMVSILSRGVDKATMTTVKAICETLGITMDGLSRGVIEAATGPAFSPEDFTVYQNRLLSQILTEGVTLDGVPLTKDEAVMIDDQIFAALDMIRRKRARRGGSRK